MLSKHEHKEALTKFMEVMGIETIVIAYRYGDSLIGRLEGSRTELEEMTTFLKEQADNIPKTNE